MKKLTLITALLLTVIGFAQTPDNTYKKRVLENTEVDFLLSYYGQDGDQNRGGESNI